MCIRVRLRTCKGESERAPLSRCAPLITAFQCWMNSQHSALGGLCTSVCVISILLTMSLAVIYTLTKNSAVDVRTFNY